MEHDIRQRLDVHEEKLTAIYKSVEQTRKLFLAMVGISIVAFILPVIGLLFAIPWFLSVMGNVYSGLI